MYFLVSMTYIVDVDVSVKLMTELTFIFGVDDTFDATFVDDVGIYCQSSRPLLSIVQLPSQG